jgi:hypothetical protein
VTPQICRVAALQKRGIRPTQISAAAEIEYFDKSTGQPRIWYSTDANGLVRLFDGEGFDGSSRVLLQPVTQEIIAAVAAQEAAAREAERQAAAERAEQEALARLVSIFDPDSYKQDVVIVGGWGGDQNDLSGDAAGLVTDALDAAVRASGRQTDRFKPAVYSLGYFGLLFDGDASVLAKVGLDAKMSSAVLIKVRARCYPADAVTWMVSCDVTTEARVLSPRNGVSSLPEQSVTGVAATNRGALTRAAETLRERYGQLLDGV